LRAFPESEKANDENEIEWLDWFVLRGFVANGGVKELGQRLRLGTVSR
jgi:hypothetical protein